MDEAHRLKNGGSKLVAALLPLRARCTVLLTGTPISNSAKDLLTIAVVALKEVVCQPRTLMHSLHQLQPDIYMLLLELARKLVLRRLLADVFPDMPAKHEFVVLCPATQLLTSLVTLAARSSGYGGGVGGGVGGGDFDGYCHVDGWQLDHSRLIGGVNNTVQRRLLCRCHLQNHQITSPLKLVTMKPRRL